jgi:hypothetical protein
VVVFTPAPSPSAGDRGKYVKILNLYPEILLLQICGNGSLKLSFKNIASPRWGCNGPIFSSKYFKMLKICEFCVYYAVQLILCIHFTNENLLIEYGIISKVSHN